MHTDELTAAFTTLFSELVNGAPSSAYCLNRGDPGLLASLERVSAAAASQPGPTGSSLAAHVAHLVYGCSLLNRWAAGEKAFQDANWSASWLRQQVTDEQWSELRRSLRAETERWLGVLGTPREVDGEGLNGMIASIVHLAYHLGAMRQIAPGARGPTAND